MNLNDHLRRIRRLLRDPNGNLWSRSFLITAFNEVQRDIQRRTHVLESVGVLPYPPQYHASFQHDWEWNFLSTWESRYFQCLRYHAQGDFTHCNIWEIQTEYGASGTVPDEGAHVTQPWESWMGMSPALPPAIKFPADFQMAKFIAFDRLPLEYLPKKQITQQDHSYQNRTGTPSAYYREGDFDNSFIPYPLPSTITWHDDLSPPADYEAVYSQSWEASDATGAQFTRDDATNARTYIHTWEIDLGLGEESFARGLWLFESDAPLGALVLYSSADTVTDPLGVLTKRPGSVFSDDLGLDVDVLDDSDNFLLIQEKLPTDLQQDTDESDFPEFLRKYIEFGVLERAYGALTDGKIASLKDYWSTRYELGIKMILKYKTLRRQDRDYRLTTSDIPRRRTYRHPSLPSTYPAIG